jgi:hypothetical protein
VEENMTVKQIQNNGTGAYVNGNGEAISDFVMGPFALVRVKDTSGEARTIFKVDIWDKYSIEAPEYIRYDVDAVLFSSVTKFQTWCNERAMSWAGSLDDLRSLFTMLSNAPSSLLLQGVTATGLYDGAFVLEHSVLGPRADEYTYVKPLAYHESRVTLRAPYRHYLGQMKDPDWLPLGDWESGLDNLAALHVPEVMTPILGWMAACPLRSLVPPLAGFPPLAVVGSAGLGKSTIVGLTMQCFGYYTGAPPVLKGSTPHAIRSAGAASNGIPIWWDEFRTGMGQETREAIDQQIRNVWNIGNVEKGGYGDNRSAIHSVSATAPLVVSGEDAFSETSHIERMIVVSLPREGRNFKAHETLITPDDYGIFLWQFLPDFFSHYIEWLLDLIEQHNLPRLPYENSRPLQSRKIAEYGYDLLTAYAVEMFGHSMLPAFDYSLVEKEQEEALALDPIDEAILEALGSQASDGAYPIVWDIPGKNNLNTRHVRVGALCTWIKRQRPDIILPGGERAIGRHLVQKYRAQEHTKPPRHRFYPIPLNDS